MECRTIVVFGCRGILSTITINISLLLNVSLLVDIIIYYVVRALEINFVEHDWKKECVSKFKKYDAQHYLSSPIGIYSPKMSSYTPFNITTTF